MVKSTVPGEVPFLSPAFTTEYRTASDWEGSRPRDNLESILNYYKSKSLSKTSFFTTETSVDDYGNFQDS